MLELQLVLLVPTTDTKGTHPKNNFKLLRRHKPYQHGCYASYTKVIKFCLEEVHSHHACYESHTKIKFKKYFTCSKNKKKHTLCS